MATDLVGKKVSAFPAQSGTDIVLADLFPNIDISVADALKTKTITFAELLIAFGLNGRGLNVKSYGISPNDTSTDYSTRFQSIINQASAARLPIFVPGDCSIRTTKNLYIPGNVSIIGEPGSEIILDANLTAADGVEYWLNFGIASKHVAGTEWRGTVSGITFRLTANALTHRLILIHKAKYFRILNNRFDLMSAVAHGDQYPNGIIEGLNDSGWCTNPTRSYGWIQNNVIEANQSGDIGSEGIGMSVADHIYIEDNVISGMGDDSIALHLVDHFTVAHNRCFSPECRIYFASSRYGTIHHNHGERTANPDATFNGGGECLRTDLYDDTSPACDGIKIDANTFVLPAGLPSQTYGIRAVGLRNSSITNNEIRCGHSASAPCGITVEGDASLGSWTDPTGIDAGHIARTRNLKIEGNYGTGTYPAGLSLVGPNNIGPINIDENAMSSYLVSGAGINFSASNRVTDGNPNGLATVSGANVIDAVVLWEGEIYIEDAASVVAKAQREGINRFYPKQKCIITAIEVETASPVTAGYFVVDLKKNGGSAAVGDGIPIDTSVPRGIKVAYDGATNNRATANTDYFEFTTLGGSGLLPTPMMAHVKVYGMFTSSDASFAAIATGGSDESHLSRYIFPGPVTLPVTDKGGQVFNASSASYAGGVILDGTTLNDAALIATIAAALANNSGAGGKVYLGPGTCKIVGPITIPDKVSWEQHPQSVIVFTGSGGLIFSGQSQCRAHGIAVQRSVRGWGNGTDSTSVAVKFKNCVDGTYDIRCAKDSVTGVLLSGDSTGSAIDCGVAWNDFHLGYLQNNRRGLAVANVQGISGGIGFCNENKFFGGHPRLDSMPGGWIMTGTRLIDLGDYPYGGDGNSFYGICLEDNTCELVVSVSSVENMFFGCRLEAIPAGKFQFGAGSSKNYVVGGYGNDGPATALFSDLSGLNVIIGSDAADYAHRTAVETLTNKTLLSPTIYGSSATKPWITETNYGYGAGYKATRIGKSSVGAYAICLGVDIAANPSGNFTGNEIIIPNAVRVVAPNAANDDFRHVISMDSGNVCRFGHAGGYNNYAFGTDATGNMIVGTITSSAQIGRVEIQSPNSTLGAATAQLCLASSNNRGVDLGGSLVLGGRYANADLSLVDFGNVAGRKENGNDGDYSGYLAFSTRRNGAAMAESFRIDSLRNIVPASGTFTILGDVAGAAGNFSGAVASSGLTNTAGFNTKKNAQASGTATNIATFSINASGTPTAGFGSIVTFAGENSATDDVTMATLTTTYTVVTAGSERTRQVFKVMCGGSLVEVVRFDGGGAAPNFSVFAAAGTGQLSSPDIGTALVGFGFATGTPTFAAANLTGLIPRRITTTNAPGATPATNSDTTDYAIFTGLATAITSMSSSLSGTPVNGQILEVSFTDDGTARGITWGTSFASTTATLPATTVISTRLRVFLEYSAATSKWECTRVA